MIVFKDDEESSRLQDEVALLEAMYPEEVTFSTASQELRYTPQGAAAAALLLRLPQGYPVTEPPEVILAHDLNKKDLHNALSHTIRDLWSGEEILDAVLIAFQTVLAEAEDAAQSAAEPVHHSAHAPWDLKQSDHAQKTTVIWLHHLLNTNKRKLAISPASQDITGITKPGYPGVLLYAGPKAAVDEHVEELRRQNWQAFQVRLEDDVAWKLEHGRGVVEMESMKDVVRDVGEGNKDAFLEAMRMK